MKVIDYGLAWIKGQPKGRVQGTPEYIAPETAAHKIVNERSDLYNFGATMYRLVARRLPPSVVSEGRLLPINAADWSKLLQPVEEFNPQAPPALCELIHRCLAFDPDAATGAGQRSPGAPGPYGRRIGSFAERSARSDGMVVSPMRKRGLSNPRSRIGLTRRIAPMAEYADREHFIPLRRGELVDLLCTDKDLPAEDRESFRHFCRLVLATCHFEHNQVLEQLKVAYAPFDPDSDVKSVMKFSRTNGNRS